jgi:hypothetical protein
VREEETSSGGRQPGRHGVRVDLNGKLIETLAGALEDLRATWETENTPPEFFEQLPEDSWTEYRSEYTDRGNRTHKARNKFVSGTLAGTNEEFRVTVMLIDGKRAQVDFRTWY